MTDILEPIKAKILRFPSQAIMFTLEEVKPLITTIESQKEEIQNQRNVIVKQGKLINSQQAITELAVNELKQIGSQSTWGLRAHINKVLAEIERLSQ